MNDKYYFSTRHDPNSVVSVSNATKIFQLTHILVTKLSFSLLLNLEIKTGQLTHILVTEFKFMKFLFIVRFYHNFVDFQ